MSASGPQLFPRARAAVVSLSLSLVILAVLELPHIPLLAYRARPFLLPQAFFRVTAEAFLYCWVNGLSVLALALLRGRPQTGLPRALNTTLTVGAAVLPAAFAYYVLQLYEPFALYPPFVAAYVALAFFTWASFALPDSGLWLNWSRALCSGRARPLHGGFALLLCVGALTVSHINYSFYKGLYPTLHLSALLVTHLLAALGSYHFVQSLKAQSSLLRRIAAPALVVLAALAPVLLAVGAVDASSPHVMAYTATGQSKVVFHKFQSSGVGGRPSLKPDEKALERFASQSGLPLLAESFRLSEFNVLLVTSEATRFDRTSLAKNEHAITPNLTRLYEQGAYSFSRAYSASSGTLHSISSVMGMTFPSALHLETYKKPWHGTLLNKNPIVPQLFAQAGYETFWIGHAYRNCFRNNIRGFEHGFSYTEFFVETKDEPSKTLDRDIVDASVSRLKKLKDSNTRFFGWVFLGGPHSPYVQHEEGPEGSDHDRYLQEIREMDRQWGRLFDELDAADLLRDTIVIYFGDHGEEFGEHGGNHHKATVYSEVVHVPLLVYIPGVKGGEIVAPVSTYYVFPWLLRSGTAAMKEAAGARIQQDIGPMMRATDGGVVVELIGHDRMLTSLVYPRIKFNYDFLSSMFEVYDLDVDPKESQSLFDTNVDLAQEAVDRIAAYKKVRAARANFILLPEDPR